MRTPSVGMPRMNINKCRTFPGAACRWLRKDAGVYVKNDVLELHLGGAVGKVYSDVFPCIA
jgi:hypothetical protein